MPDLKELGRRVKAKYPGYADLSDVEVGRRVKSKYPNEYADFTDAPKRSASMALLGYESSTTDPYGDRRPSSYRLPGPSYGESAKIGAERGYRKYLEPALSSIGEVTEGMKIGDFGPALRMGKEALLGTVRALTGPPSSSLLDAEVEAAKQRARQAGIPVASDVLRAVDVDPLRRVGQAMDPAIKNAQRARERRYLASPEGRRSQQRLAELDARAALDPSYTGKAIRGGTEFLTGAAPTLAAAVATRGAILPTALTAAAQSAGNPSQMLPQAAAGALPIAPIKALRNLRGRTTAPAQVRPTQPLPAQADAPVTGQMPNVLGTPEFTAAYADAPTGGLPMRAPYRSGELPELSTGEIPSLSLRADLSPPRQYPGRVGPEADEVLAFDAGSRPLSRPAQPPQPPDLAGNVFNRPPRQQPLFDAAAGSPWQDAVLAYYRANLLTNPVGRALDLGSTVVNQFADAAVRPVAAAIDVVVSKLTKKRSITGPSFRGSGRAFGSIPQGLRDAREVLRTGRQTIDSGSDDVLYGAEIRSGLGKGFDVPVNGVFRLLGAMDAPFRRFGFARNLHDRARVAAINEVKAGRIASNRVRARQAELMDRDDIINAAVRDGERAVLSEPNRISSWITSQMRNSPNARLAFGIVQPFMRIPLNAILRSADFAGIGGIKALYKIARGTKRKIGGQSFFRDLEEQRVFAQNVASGSFAPAAFLLGMELEEQGKLEGYYYTSRKDFPNGGVPTSIEIGGERYDVNRLGGFIAAPLFIGATYNRLRKQDVGQANALLRSFSGLIQQAPALGYYGAPAKIGRILTADEPGEEIITEAGSITSGFIPASGAMGAAAKALDPVKKREAKGFTGPILNRIPGLRERLPEKKQATRRKK